MAINFPASPTSGDNHTVGNKSWQWDGEKWNTKGTFVSPSILKVDQANSRVGIGTTTPVTPLHIESDDGLTTFTGTGRGAMSIANTAYTSGDLQAIDFMYLTGSNPSVRIAAEMTGGGSLLHFGTSNAYATGITNQAMTIDATGKVGIGTNAPTYPLHVQSDTHPQLFIQAATNADAVIRSGSGPSWVNNFHQIRFNHYAVASGHGPDNKINFEVNGGTEATPTTRMTINGDGKVGIGTTTPDEALEVVGSIHIPSGSNVWIGNNANSGERFRMHHSGTNSYVDYASGDVLFRANGTSTTLTLKAGGKVGIGTTAPVRRLTVESDLCVATGNTAYLWQTNTVNTNLQLWSKTASGDTGWGQRVYMTQSATSWAAGSDRRIKRDIVDHGGDLAEVLGLRVRSYNFNDDAADQPARYGFITDEVPASLGHLVTGEAGAVTIDEETGEEKPDPQGLFYTDLIPHLVGAIQELSAQNASLVARIETLETA